MNEAVTGIFRCRCGARVQRKTELFFHGEIAGVFAACEKCIGECNALLDRVRPIFEAMIAAGVPHDLANYTMTAMISDPRCSG